MAGGITADSRPYRWPWHGAFAPSQTALLVVVDGNIAPPGEAMSAEFVRFIGIAKAAGLTIAELPDAKGSSILPVGMADLSVTRPHIGGFSGTDLDSVLRQRGLTDLILAGFPFELGADCTMRQANDLGYECLALTDCCTGLAADTLAGAISSIQMSGGIFGAVATSTAVLELLAQHQIRASVLTSDRS